MDRLSKFIGGLGVGKKGNGYRTECGGGVVFGEESEGEGISNSLWGELSKFIGGLGVGKKGDGDQTESRGDVIFGEESAGEGGEAVVDVLDKGRSILGLPFWRVFYQQFKLEIDQELKQEQI